MSLTWHSKKTNARRTDTGERGRIEKAVGKKGQGVEEDKDPGKRDQGHKTQLD